MRASITQFQLAEMRKRFADDTKNHHYVVEHDDGAMKCILAKAYSTSAYWFRVVTWAKTLAISGDMGCFVFSRHNEFDGTKLFRGDAATTGDIQYIASKVIASSNPVHEFDLERTITNLLVDFGDVLGDKADEFKEHFDSVSQTDEDEFHDALSSFEVDSGIAVTTDWHEYDVRSFSEHFVWCVLAIIKTIQEYDKTKKVEDV